MSAAASQITRLTVVYSPVHIKENIKAPRHWCLWWEFTGDRWIPRTKASNAEKVSISWGHHGWNPGQPADVLKICLLQIPNSVQLASSCRKQYRCGKITDRWIMNTTILFVNPTRWMVLLFWLPAWWALRLPGWPPEKCSNVSMLCAFLVFTKWFPFLHHCCILGAVSIRKTVLPGVAIPMLKIRRPNGRLIFNMEITIRR